MCSLDVQAEEKVSSPLLEIERDTEGSILQDANKKEEIIETKINLILFIQLLFYLISSLKRKT